jgi:hypothetical protein
LTFQPHGELARATPFVGNVAVAHMVLERLGRRANESERMRDNVSDVIVIIIILDVVRIKIIT